MGQKYYEGKQKNGAIILWFRGIAPKATSTCKRNKKRTYNKFNLNMYNVRMNIESLNMFHWALEEEEKLTNQEKVKGTG